MKMVIIKKIRLVVKWLVKEILKEIRRINSSCRLGFMVYFFLVS